MLFFSFWLPWQPELWLEFNLLNNFGRASPKEHPCQVPSRLAQWFRRRRCLKKLWTTHAGHWAITKAHHEHFVLRWAKKLLNYNLPMLYTVSLFPKRQNLNSSKMKEFADVNFKFVESRKKFFQRQEKTVGKGEIARYEQFLLFPQCFQKTCTADT